MKADLDPWSPKGVRTPNLFDAFLAKYDIQLGPALLASCAKNCFFETGFAVTWMIQGSTRKSWIF